MLGHGGKEYGERPQEPDDKQERVGGDSLESAPHNAVTFEHAARSLDNTGSLALRKVASRCGVAPWFRDSAGEQKFLKSETVRDRVKQAMQSGKIAPAEVQAHIDAVASGAGEGLGRGQDGQGAGSPGQGSPGQGTPSGQGKGKQGTEDEDEQDKPHDPLRDAVESIVDEKIAEHLERDPHADAERVQAAVRDVLEKHEADGKLGVRRIELKIGDLPEVKIESPHNTFADLLYWLATPRVPRGWCNVWLAGAAGGGKTTAAEQAAQAFGQEFRCDGVSDTDYKILGYVHPTLGPILTPFRDAYVNGHLYLADEFDAWQDGARLALNAALANGHCTFPGESKPTPAHPEFRCVVACNTWGWGGDAQYVGRNRPDAATLDRFVFLAWNYDERLERAIALGINPDAGPWVDRVQRARKIAFERGMHVTISPRASLQGAAALLRPGSSADKIAGPLYLDRMDPAARAVLK